MMMNMLSGVTSVCVSAYFTFDCSEELFVEFFMRKTVFSSVRSLRKPWYRL